MVLILGNSCDDAPHNNSTSMSFLRRGRQLSCLQTRTISYIVSKSLRMLSLLCMWPILPVSVDFKSENDMTNLYPEWYFLLVSVWHAFTRLSFNHIFFPSRETLRESIFLRKLVSLFSESFSVARHFIAHFRLDFNSKIIYLQQNIPFVVTYSSTSTLFSLRYNFCTYEKFNLPSC